MHSFDRGTPFKSLAQLVRVLQIITVALIAGVALLAGLSMIVEADTVAEDLRWPLLGTSALLTGVAILVALVAAPSFLRSSLEKLDQAPIVQKLQRILSIRILTLAVVEAPGLLWIICSVLTGEQVWLGGAALSILLLAGLFPNEQQFEEWLQMSSEEIEQQLQREMPSRDSEGMS